MQIVKGLMQRGKLVHVTASTGIAAVNVGGVTIHSFAGIQKVLASWLFSACRNVLSFFVPVPFSPLLLLLSEPSS
jgi:hypothetical protein